MIDYFLRFNTENDAINAATGTALGQFDNNSPPVWRWNTHFVLPNVQAWRISQDTHNPDGSITHNYLSGWMCLVATVNVNAQLDANPALQFSLNRDGPPYVVKNNLSAALLQDIGVQPIFAGSHYPIGGYN